MYSCSAEGDARGGERVDRLEPQVGKRADGVGVRAFVRAAVLPRAVLANSFAHLRRADVLRAKGNRGKGGVWGGEVRRRLLSQLGSGVRGGGRRFSAPARRSERVCGVVWSVHGVDIRNG